jgi:hypothetical protein
MVALAVVASIALVSGAACGGGHESAVKVADLDKLATKSALRARTFTSTSTVGGARVTVVGLVEDDYRYAATVSLNGAPVWEEVVVDDKRYVRVINAAALFDADTAASLSTIVSGAWVVDGNGAPAEFTPETTVVPLAPDLVLSYVRVLDTVPQLTKLGYVEWNPQGASYLPRSDKFPAHKDNGKRFDHLPTAYDANQVLNGLDATRPYFEYVSLWANDRGVTRIERTLELPDPADKRYAEMYTQLRRAGSRRLLALLQEGSTPRARALQSSAVIGSPSPTQHVVEPTGAQPVDLVAAITALRQRLAALAVPSPLYGPIT